MKNAYLTDVLFRLEQVSRDVHDHFYNLEATQLLWQPAEHSWSIAQCLSHLIVTDTSYFPQVESVLNGTYTRPALSYLPFLTGFWGRVILKTVGARVNTPIRTLEKFQPEKNINGESIVRRYEEHIEKLSAYIRKTDSFKHKRIYFKSPAGQYIVYSLKHTLMLMANHHERHYHQALQVMQMPLFPKDRLNMNEE